MYNAPFDTDAFPTPVHTGFEDNYVPGSFRLALSFTFILPTTLLK